MREREQQTAAVPPAELTDYETWSLSRGLAPFGHSEAVAQWKTWEGLRREWSAAHGVDEGDLGGGDSAPFDIDAI